MFHEYKKNPPLNAAEMLSQATIKRLSLLNRIIHQYHSRTVNNRNSVPVFFSVLTKIALIGLIHQLVYLSVRTCNEFAIAGTEHF